MLIWCVFSITHNTKATACALGVTVSVRFNAHQTEKKPINRSRIVNIKNK